MAAQDLVEVVHELRMQLGERGGATMASLALAFRVNDVSKSGIFNFKDFEDILGRVGLFAPRQSLTKLYRHFDPDLQERLDYREFLRALTGEQGERRDNIIRLVWDKLACGRESIPVKLVVGAFSAAKNPRVLSGEKTEQQVFREFVTNFECAGNVDGMVDAAAFYDFYCAISASVPYNDDYFIEDMELAWGVTENTTQVPVPTALIRKVENVLREKIRQRAKADGNEVEGLRLTFKYFDLEDTGLIDYKNFMAALERYGIQLSPDVAAGLYADFESADGLINYSEFVAALYHGEALVPAYSGRGQNVPGRVGSGIEAVFVMGGPCSGTVAVCAAIKETLGYVYLDANALVDAESLDPDSQLGAKIDSYVRLRKKIPSSLTMEALLKTMQLYAGEGKMSFVVDGFPTTLEDMDAWEDAAHDHGLAMPMALHLEIPRSLMVQRMVIRDPQRLTVEAKIGHYECNTLALVGQLEREKRLVSINAEAKQDQVNQQALAVLRSL